MENFFELIRYIIIAVFAFFVTAPCVLNAISLFGVQKKFALEMIKEGIVPAKEVEQLHPKKQIAGVIISCVVIGALAVICVSAAPIGYYCGGASLLAGFIKYRKVLEYNSFTVQRFKNSYKDSIDTAKYNRYIKSHF